MIPLDDAGERDATVNDELRYSDSHERIVQCEFNL